MIKKEKVLKNAKNIYLTGIIPDFVMAERMPYSRYKRAIKNKLMNAYTYHADEQQVGYVVTMESDEAVFISYLGIKKEYRNKGYGSGLIKELTEIFGNKKYIIIEVDSPVGIKKEKDLEIINKRRNFYYKNGFEEVEGIDYTFFGVRYDLFVLRLNCDKITNTEAIKTIKGFYSKIVSKNMKHLKIDTKQ